jgi:hypothetical protein
MTLSEKGYEHITEAVRKWGNVRGLNRVRRFQIS